MAKAKKGLKKNEPTQEERLLKEINKIQKELGTRVYYRILPETISGCENLKGRRVMLIDNSPLVIAFLSPDLVVQTNGKASFVLNKKGETLENLARRISGKKPEVVLVDGELESDLTGYNLVTLLKRIDQGVRCIGFSDNPMMEECFTEYGADGFIERRVSDPKETMLQIAKTVACVLQ